MAEELRESLQTLSERGIPRGATAVLTAARSGRDGAVAASRAAGWRVAMAAAVAVLLGIGSVLLLDPLGGDDDSLAASAIPGSVTIVLDEWTGMEGYQVLAVVYAVPGSEPPLAGGAFWTMIDADPFTASDEVHPPLLGGDDLESDDWKDWAADDYAWDQTAILPPGRYEIQIVANPEYLVPIGSHIPAAGAERECAMTLDLVAGEAATIVVPTPPRLPGGSGACVEP